MWVSPDRSSCASLSNDLIRESSVPIAPEVLRPIFSTTVKIPVDIQGVECRAGDSIASVVLATTAMGARQSHPASAALHLTEPCLAAHHVGHLAVAFLVDRKSVV